MLEPDEYVERFIPIVQAKYPDMTPQEINHIVKAPFVFLRKMMAKDTWPSIRFKYWGVFAVKKGRAEQNERIADVAILNGNLTQEKYLKIKQAVKLNKNEQN